MKTIEFSCICSFGLKPNIFSGQGHQSKRYLSCLLTIAENVHPLVFINLQIFCRGESRPLVTGLKNFRYLGCSSCEWPLRWTQKKKERNRGHILAWSDMVHIICLLQSKNRRHIFSNCLYRAEQIKLYSSITGKSTATIWRHRCQDF